MSDDEQFFRRQGFWLRMARERAGLSQAGAAELLELSKKSKSSISDYETGATHASQDTLLRLARHYRVPIGLFTEPGPTADEYIEARMEELARRAAEQERRDWPLGEDRGRASDDETAGGLGRRSA